MYRSSANGPHKPTENGSHPAEEKEVLDKVKLKDLPRYADLKKQVDDLVSQCSWWDRWGVDWLVVCITLVMFPVGMLLLGSYSWIKQALGLFLLATAHSSITVKTAHSAIHGALSPGYRLVQRRILTSFCAEFIGNFSEELAYDIHIKEHHPHTNIIGRGDSSAFKVPFLPKYTYMFFAPLLFPIAAVFVSVAGLLEKRSFLGLLRYIVVCGAGLACIVIMMMRLSNLSVNGALLCIWLYQAIYSIPYVHVNIFQHIGLPMYSQENRPVRIYQMSTGVLNLPRNILLDYAFGHSLINCHVEHHLFPSLSDNMCLKIKPLVSKFLKDNGLPYKKATYMGKLRQFLSKYEELMVNAPPITHFVGIQ